MPCLWVFAGPNGSGKSTVTSGVRERTPGVYVNADDIRTHLSCTSEEAAVIAEETREYYLARGEDFTMETVLSTDRNLKLMLRAKAQGYTVSCLYVLTNDPEINVARVIRRNRWNGDDVPSDKVRARYLRCVALFPQLIPLCDHMLVFDNSGDSGSHTAAMILYVEDGQITEVIPNPYWPEKSICELVNGTYGERFRTQE